MSIRGRAKSKGDVVLGRWGWEESGSILEVVGNHCRNGRKSVTFRAMGMITASSQS